MSGDAPNGNVRASDMTQYFAFDWASHSAVYTYDYGYHEANGNFSGTLRAVPEGSNAALMLGGSRRGAGLALAYSNGRGADSRYLTPLCASICAK